jgi:hypothetical protein
VLTSLEQVLFANIPELRIVSQQISEFSPLLHEIGFRQSGDLLVEPGDAHNFTENTPSILEAQRLVEVAGH